MFSYPQAGWWPEGVCGWLWTFKENLQQQLLSSESSNPCAHQVDVHGEPVWVNLHHQEWCGEFSVKWKTGFESVDLTQCYLVVALTEWLNVKLLSLVPVLSVVIWGDNVGDCVPGQDSLSWNPQPWAAWHAAVRSQTQSTKWLRPETVSPFHLMLNKQDEFHSNTTVCLCSCHHICKDWFLQQVQDP